jgi:hypothetical protein
MTQIRIFAAELFDRVSGVPMRLEGWRCLDDADFPFYVADLNGSKWTMTENEASRLSMAAHRVKWRIERAAKKNERAKAGAVFRRKLSSDDESVQAVIELGLVATGEIVAVYFEFAGTRVHPGGEQGPEFLKLLVRFGDSVAELHKAQPGGGSFDLLAPPDWGFPRDPGW